MKTDYTYHYRKWHDDSIEHRHTSIRYYQRLFSPHVPADHSVRVLDIGCGMGFAMLALQEMGFPATSGIDSDEGQVNYCRQQGLDVSFSSDSAGYLREHAGQFGLMIACDLLEHIPVAEQMAFVAAMSNALRSGGVLICTMPNANSVLAGRTRYLDWTHQTSFTEHSLDFLLYNGGFRDIRVLPLEYFDRPRWWWWPNRVNRHYWAWRFFRFWRRMELMAELGRPGRTVPISMNLLGLARKP